jgi:hypothetical protein
MGKAAVDLPDPLETSLPRGKDAKGSARSGAAADDLLAQLAGDEIDRLLAEADATRPEDDPVSNPPGSGVVPAPVEVPPIEPLLPAARPLSGAPVTPASATKADLDASLSAELDVLFSDLEKETPEDATPAAPPAAVKVTQVAVLAADAIDRELVAAEPRLAAETPKPEEPSAAAEVAAELAEAEAQTSPAERMGLTTVAELAASIEAPQAQTDADDADPNALPFYLLPLEWLNAPLDALPDSTRELVGKVAIVTLLNAVAVLAYVFLFRHH